MNHPTPPTADKKALRAHFSALRNALSGEARAAAETAIREKLFSLEAFGNAPLVCGYMSMRGEIDLMPIWRSAAAAGKGYALPVTVTDTKEGQMIFRRTAGFSPEALIPARFGVLEPSAACPVLSPADFAGAVILVPGLAFDEAGFRIGYGGGYYDRFLAALRAARVPAVTVGLAFSVCRAEKLPHDPYDIPVDLIIDERRITEIHG